MMKKPGFCLLRQIHGNYKLIEKYCSRRGQKWVWPLLSEELRIGCISSSNQWNKVTFDVLIQIQES